jgi:DNA-binding transcriptional MocR family regulator
MHARRPEFRDLIERSLQRELTARRELRPHAQLAIQPNAPRAAVEEAYQRLRARYDANAFAEYGDVAVAATQGIAELIRVAYEAMLQPPPVEGGEPKVLVKLEPKPRGDETCRALETLRGAIERRIGEAQAHRAAGRLQDALRVLESVLVLDRQNKLAQDGVRELRIALEPPKKPTTWSRVFGRLFRRRQPVEAVVRVGGG